MLIVNADDWGRDQETTDRILDCMLAGSVTATSAMVFMEDSDRAAALAQERQFDTGLHINLISPFTAQRTPELLLEHQRRISGYLLRHRFTRIVYHPGLANSFEYVVQTQLDEYTKSYGFSPYRVDGHHHMHQCANVLLAKLLPAGTIARRNFTFREREKGTINRFYRKLVDDKLAQRHVLVDCLYSILPLEVERIQRIVKEAAERVIELETHPINRNEFEFLTAGGFRRCLKGMALGNFRSLLAADRCACGAKSA